METLAKYIMDILTDKFFVPAENLGPSVAFESLEFDSLVLAELAVILQGRFGVPVQDFELSEEMTIGELAAMLAAKGVTV